MPHNLLVLLHIVFVSCFLGGQAYYLFIAQPASYRFFSTNDQARYLQNLLSRQNPILLMAICLVVLTGGFLVMSRNDQIRAAVQMQPGLVVQNGQAIAADSAQMVTDYITKFGHKMTVKLSFFFLAFFVTAYQTLAVGFKIRYSDAADPDENLRAKLSSVRNQMTITTILNISIVGYIVYYSKFGG